MEGTAYSSVMDAMVPGHGGGMPQPQNQDLSNYHTTLSLDNRTEWPVETVLTQPQIQNWGHRDGVRAAIPVSMSSLQIERPHTEEPNPGKCL